MGNWYLSGTEEADDLERIIGQATSPSLLLKAQDADSFRQLAEALSQGGWNVIATNSEELYRTLAYEGGIDIVMHEKDQTLPRLNPGTHECAFSLLNVNDIDGTVALLDQKFIEYTKPNISFSGLKPMFQDFRGGMLAITFDMEQHIHHAAAGPFTDLVVCDDSASGENFAKRTNAPVVAITTAAENVSQYRLKPEDLKNGAILLSTLRRALAGNNKNEVNHKRTIVYVQSTAKSDALTEWLRKEDANKVGHAVGVLRSSGRNNDLDDVIDLLNKKVRGPSEDEDLDLALPRNVDLIMGDLTPDFLEFLLEAAKSKRVNARQVAVTPYASNVDKLSALHFLLSGGHAFVPLEKKDWHMVQILLRNLKRRPRLPFRSKFDDWDSAVAETCRKAEKDILSRDDEGIHKGIASLFHAVALGRTGLAAATLAYGIMNIRDELALFEKSVRFNYRLLTNPPIALYDLRKHLSRSDEPNRKRVRNLRRVVFTSEYPPDYDLFRKNRSLEEGERYVKVFDFFRRLNRRYRRTENGCPVGLSELVHAQRVDKDRYLLVEVEAHKKHETLLDRLARDRADNSAVWSDFEEAIRQAARMTAQGPLLAAEQVDDLAAFWNERFDIRIYSPIIEGMGLFDKKIAADEFTELRDALKKVWDYLAHEKLITGFYSDRWPGNMGVRDGNEVYNLGFRMCYRIPAIIDEITVFQHTDYLPGSSIEERIQNAEHFIRSFFAEFDRASLAFSREIVDKYNSSPKNFILEEILEDINAWKAYQFAPRTPETPVEDPIYMSLASRNSLSNVLLYPNQETLAQMLGKVESLPADAAADTIYEELRNYARASQRVFEECKQVIARIRKNLPDAKGIVDRVNAELRKVFNKEKKTLPRIRAVIATLPYDADIDDVEKVLFQEFDEKPALYVNLLESLGQNLTARQSIYEFEGGQEQFEGAVKTKYVPVHFVAMMERGLIAAGALFNTMIDIKRYTICRYEDEGHPFDPVHLPEYERLLDIAKMSVMNSLRATEACKSIFGGKNEALVQAADRISKFDRALYENICAVYDERIRRAGP